MTRSGLPNSSASKQVSATELLDEAIARTAKVDPQINAVVVKHYDHAKQQIDKGLPDGPFAGVPFLLKDLDLLQGTVTTFGASVYQRQRRRSHRHPRPAFSRNRRRDLRQELKPRIRPDADHGIAAVRPDPQSLESRSLLRRVVRRGGSGGGGARILPMAHASDGGGSIRIPASASGVFGMKPTPRAQSARPRSR